MVVGPFEDASTVPYAAGVSDGYWVMLAPPQRGPHTIAFHGAVETPNGSFETTVTYHLNVVAPR